MATIIVGTLQIIPLRLFSLLKVPEVSKTELLINALSREKAFKDLSQEKNLTDPYRNVLIRGTVIMIEYATHWI